MSAPKPNKYLIKKGDTFRTVSRQFGVSPKNLIALNNLKFPFNLKAGKLLLLTDEKNKKQKATPTKKAPAKNKLKPTRRPKTKTNKKTIKTAASKSKTTAKRKRLLPKQPPASTLVDPASYPELETISEKLTPEKESNHWFLKSVLVIIAIIIGLILIRVYILNSPSNRFESKNKEYQHQEISPQWDTDQKTEQEYFKHKIESYQSAPEIAAPATIDPAIEAESVLIETPPPRLIILNGSGKQGLAHNIKNKFSAKKIEIIKTGNADNFKYENTLIKYPIEKLDQALIIKGYCDELNLKYQMKESFDVEEVTMVIGQDN
jgi:murein DD-endopeptidase MepM/ murein hydrolase activator NlpD